MSDENKAPSLSELFDSSLQTEDAVTEDQTSEDEALDTDEASDDTDTKEVPEKEEDLDKVLSEQEKLNERFKETQKWGNKAHQNYIKSLEKLHAVGEITDEELEKAKKEGIATEQNDMQAHSKEFWEQYGAVKDFLVDNGQNPDELVESFMGVCGRDQNILNEFMTLPANKKVKFVLEQGRDVLELHQNLKKYGSYGATLKAIKKAAVDEYLKGAPAPTKQDDADNSVKKRPRIASGGADVETQVITQPSLTQLMGN